MVQFLMMHQLTVNPDDIMKAAKEFGFSPETLLIPAPAPPMAEPGAAEGAIPPEAMGGV